jgi:hypothetical protein
MWLQCLTDENKFIHPMKVFIKKSVPDTLRPQAAMCFYGLPVTLALKLLKTDSGQILGFPSPLRCI